MSENKNLDELGIYFSQFRTGFALSKAMFEDYIQVVAKIENVEPSIVKDRVWKKATQYFDESKEQS